MTMCDAIPDVASLRLLWSVVEDTPTQTLLTLDATLLARQLMQRVNQRVYLHANEQDRMQTYLASRLPLIRTLAESRLSP